MQVIICSNTETIRPIWEDIFTDADWYDASDWHEDIAKVWLDVFHKGLMDAGFDYEYESNFAKWHGGPYSGVYHCPAEIDVQVQAAKDKADAAAREAAKHDVAEMLAAQAEEE